MTRAIGGDLLQQGDDAPMEINRVELEGRLSGTPETRSLPSGDELTTFRIVVRRPPGARVPSVDAIDCVVWARGLARRVQSWEPHSRVTVEGSLRRRFWRGASGVSSRTEVEVERARLVRRVGAAERMRN